MNAWEKFVDKTLDKFRLAAGGRGYTCDSCGKEIFEYPRERLCPKCLAALQKSEGEACPKCGRKTCAPGVCLECKAEALAVVAADCLNFDPDKELLVKTRETRPQKRLSKEERERNLSGVYAIKRGASCRGKRVLLVDDTMTTGTTGSECAKRLFDAGAAEVWLLTAAAMPEKK